jgi:hypothetical protein
MQKGAKNTRFKLEHRPIIKPALCKPAQEIVVIPPKSKNIFENCNTFSDAVIL